MAPNKRGGSLTATSVLTKEEIEARGAGTKEDRDTYHDSPFKMSETRVFFTG